MQVLSHRRTSVVILLVAAAVLGGCRSRSESEPAAAAGGARGPRIRFALPPPEANIDDVSGVDAALYAGTAQDLTLTGSVTGKITSAGRGKRVLSGCVKVHDRSFAINLLGLLDGKDPYRLEFGVLSDYSGPRTYPLSTIIQAGQGVVAYVKNSRDKNSGLIGYAGTLTVNADERSGAIDAQLRGGFGRPERARIVGTWTCPSRRG